MTKDFTERLPSRAEIGDHRDLDGACAIKNFHGKTLAEAEQLFANANNGLIHTGDLMWMRPTGFRFYLPAAIRHCLSERATGDCDLINGMAGTIAFWHEEHPKELVPVARLIADFCSAVCDRFDRYQADPKIYKGLREQYQHLAEVFTRIANETGNA